MFFLHGGLLVSTSPSKAQKIRGWMTAEPPQHAKLHAVAMTY